MLDHLCNTEVDNGNSHAGDINTAATLKRKRGNESKPGDGQEQSQLNRSVLLPTLSRKHISSSDAIC